MGRNTVSTSSYSSLRHLVALPYPGRGHINPMMNLCRALSSASPYLLITFVVTDEWLSLIDRSPLASIPDNLLFSTIPNVIPSESTRGNDFLGFLEAVMTKMEAPLEQLLDGFQQSQPAPSLLLFDTCLWWVVGVGARRGIPVASFWTQSSARLLQQLRLLLRPGTNGSTETAPMLLYFLGWF
ncbi:hypothetical protein MLD38_008410 [Melastoma candidum]|uniref:Uncharacterized protein n=1 Tax=Melastoma candidum TaxID=119954 RepID=A0ACB9RXA7_9MYRT|nr:hypothetical protein MLD38_008410 [Melastoma candidum]